MACLKMCANCLMVTSTLILVILNELISGQSFDWPKNCPEIVSREAWGADPAVVVEYAIFPVKYAIIHHTVTSTCNSLEACSEFVKGVQYFHMEDMEFHDIGYNFLVGGDGRIYEGAGWHKVGAHTRGYNTRSIGIAVIGDFSSERPKNTQLKALKKFLECAVNIRELDPNYVLYGGKQVTATMSPGRYLYSNLKDWPHFGTTPLKNNQME